MSEKKCSGECGIGGRECLAVSPNHGLLCTRKRATQDATKPADAVTMSTR